MHHTATSIHGITFSRHPFDSRSASSSLTATVNDSVRLAIASYFAGDPLSHPTALSCVSIATSAIHGHRTTPGLAVVSAFVRRFLIW